ncbi:aspartate/glutamate racemase family protein [Puniceibacterium sediminis]|uniref:Allantoin racemase n=1 Tax=Puniceibacterium sediminis TaxID=1608407 RepID=A0A238WL69_9RHOB|nr:aspartate/glutamate racemase family protein [Puniceibacterium sediminis]SNR47326.1 allantoin racemase [Puniceibacterium sediminis]
MIVLINPNSTVSMTDAMERIALDVAPDFKIVGWTSHDGPPAIQGPEDGAASVPPLLELVAKASELGARAVIIGCFDDTGLNEARAIANCPVIGIGQAAYHMAVLAGPRFSVVTTLEVSVPVLEENIHAYGLAGHLGRVRASGVAVLDLEREADAAALRVLEEISAAAREDDVDSIVLGCAGMVDLPSRAEAATNLRIIDGVRAAVQIACLM